MEGVELTAVMLPILIGLCTYMTASLVEIRRNIRDLHSWHAPDSDGRQNWKLPELVQLIEKIDKLIQTMESKLP